MATGICPRPSFALPPPPHRRRKQIRFHENRAPQQPAFPHANRKEAETASGRRSHEGCRFGAILTLHNNPPSPIIQ